jgi:hypothetical protein
MNRRDQLLHDATAAALEVAVRRAGLPALEAALARFSDRQRKLLASDFIDTLQRHVRAMHVADLKRFATTGDNNDQTEI